MPMACTVVQYTRDCPVKNTTIIMKFIVWIINDIHVKFNDIHWEGCLHITRHSLQSVDVGHHDDVFRILIAHSVH